MHEFKQRSDKSAQDRIRSYGGTPGRATGGKVHSDVKEDRALIKKMVEPSALKRAAGGHVKSKKPHTAINIAIAPHGPDAPAPMPGAGAAAPVPPPPAPRPAPVAPKGAPPMAGAPNIGGLGDTGPLVSGAKRGGGIGRAAGGKVRRDDGGSTTVAKTSTSNPPAPKPSDDDYTKYDMVRKAKLSPASGLTNVENSERQFEKGRAAGGKVHMTAGSASGEGRLEKIKEYGSKAGAKKL